MYPGVTVVNRVVREGLNQVTSEQRRRRWSKPCRYLGEEQVQSLRQEPAWLLLRKRGAQCGQSKQARWRVSAGEFGEVMWGPIGTELYMPVKTVTFTFSSVGAMEGFG